MKKRLPENETTEGVLHDALTSTTTGTVFGLLTDTTVLVVPKSIPNTIFG